MAGRILRHEQPPGCENNLKSQLVSSASFLPPLPFLRNVSVTGRAARRVLRRNLWLTTYSGRLKLGFSWPWLCYRIFGSDVSISPGSHATATATASHGNQSNQHHSPCEQDCTQSFDELQGAGQLHCGGARRGRCTEVRLAAVSASTRSGPCFTGRLELDCCWIA